MEVVSMNRLLYFPFFFVFFSLWIFSGVHSNRGGFLYFKFLCYKNPGHLDAKGGYCDAFPSQNCDPFFTICISNRYIRDEIKIENCPIYYMNTSPYDNSESVCDSPHDNRGVLANLVTKELSYPFQKTFYVKIEIRDSDGWKSGQDLIATFGAELTQTPSFNFLTPSFKELQMFRSEYRYSNSKTSLKIALALQCDRDRYGDYCLTFCRATQSTTYICSKNGEKICNEGWKGEHCLDIDVCVFQSCIVGAQCIEINNVAKCMCDGQIGPQCYPNYNPCLINPCQNEGRCMPNKTHETGIRCQCQQPFQGSRCENKIDICLLEPCHNNATCEYDKNYVRHCKCLEGFIGVLCDQQQYNQNFTSSVVSLPLPYAQKSNAVTILSISFGISILLLTLILVIYFLKKRNKKKHSMKNQTQVVVNMADLDKRLNGPNSIPNEYTEKTKTETIYETVNDQDTYAYLIEKNDEYLIPSRPTTPGFASTPGGGSTVYMDMFNTFEGHDHQRDSSDLPPLPTRDQKGKLSLKNFCIP